MNWVDIFVAVLVLGLGLLGWRNGLVQWAFTLVGGILGIVLAGRLYTTLAPLMPLGESEGLREVAAFGVVFLTVLVAAWVLARIIKTVLSMLMLGWVDHGAGAVLGVLAGALAATALISAMGIIPSGSLQNAVNDSTLAEPLVSNMQSVLAFLPSEFRGVQELLGG